MYTVTDLGAANPSQNSDYLALLPPSVRASFQAGSFDVHAHPYTGGTLPIFLGTGDVATPSANLTHTAFFSDLSFVTSNNQGVSAGTGVVNSMQNDYGDAPQIVTFASDPHTVSYLPTSSDGPLLTMSSPGHMYDFPSPYPNGFFGNVTGINDNGLIIGTWPGDFGSAFIYDTKNNTYNWSPGFLAQTANGAARSGANALDDSNQIVGWAATASGANHAYVYDAAQGITKDLNNMIPATSSFVLTDGVGIDASGQIVAYGTTTSGATHEYLLTPSTVPEPSTLALMVVGALAIAARRLRPRAVTSP